MKRTSIATLAAATVVAVGASLAPLSTSATADVAKEGAEVPTFAEFKKDTHRDENGVYVVNGDIPIRSTTMLREYYDLMVASDDEADTSASLVVNRIYGSDDLWTASQAQNLTYCVSNGFGSNKTAVVDATAQGAGLWESATSGVNFTYVPAQDGSCNVRNTNVTFSVEPTTTTSYIARAFFPSSPKSQRNVLVNAASLQSSGNWEASDIMSHELGHVLGFRHEHTRPEAGACFEDSNWRPLTAYDSVSIMHYPQCNGGSDDLEFSTTDGQGVRSVY